MCECDVINKIFKVDNEFNSIKKHECCGFRESDNNRIIIIIIIYIWIFISIKMKAINIKDDGGIGGIEGVIDNDYQNIKERESREKKV